MHILNVGHDLLIVAAPLGDSGAAEQCQVCMWHRWGSAAPACAINALHYNYVCHLVISYG